MQMQPTSPDEVMAHEMVMTITSKGQVTIPAAVRRLLGVQKGQKIALVVEPRMKVVQWRLPQYPSVASLAGAAGRMDRAGSWRDIKDTARQDTLEGKFRLSR